VPSLASVGLQKKKEWVEDVWAVEPNEDDVMMTMYVRIPDGMKGME